MPMTEKNKCSVCLREWEIKKDADRAKCPTCGAPKKEMGEPGKLKVRFIEERFEL